MTNYVSINGHVIRKNAKTGADEPPIRIVKSRGDRKPRYAHEIEVSGTCRIVYKLLPILSCGARVVLQTEQEVKILR